VRIRRAHVVPLAPKVRLIAAGRTRPEVTVVTERVHETAERSVA
jgi:hypothetical protein